MDVRLTPLPQELRNQITYLSSVLSAFEESSAACISDMLRQVRDEQYLEAIRMAEKFILHIEVFFVMSNDLEVYFFWTITNVLDMFIENRELININVHIF